MFRATRIRAQDSTATSDEVALKLYNDPSEDERVEREIAMMHGVRHPSLATLIEHGHIDLSNRRHRYVAWEFIDGIPLNVILARGQLSPRETAVLGCDIARALDYIWSNHKVVHRDVNPKNIMIRAGGAGAVLIDLGAARHLSLNTITAAGSSWGTDGYLSPEQARAETNLSCLSDVFCLGVTLLEAVGGSHPTARNQYQLVFNTPKAATVAATCPAALAAIIDSMLLPRAAFRPSPNVLVQRFTTLIPIL